MEEKVEEKAKVGRPPSKKWVECIHRHGNVGVTKIGSFDGDTTLLRCYEVPGKDGKLKLIGDRAEIPAKEADKLEEMNAVKIVDGPHEEGTIPEDAVAYTPSGIEVG